MRLLVLLVALLATPAAAENMPRLEERGEAVQLIVDDQPFLILGGELGNSSATDRAYMAEPWAKLRAMNLNTVLAPVYWEMVEAQEGRFDFSVVDGMIEDARAHDMRLVLLWFGVWKNSMSSHVPSWVKRDSERFPRTLGADGRAQEILSAYSTQTRNADARAFAAFMRHLKTVDADRRTVIMVQVENEIGFLPFAKEGEQGDDAASDERGMARGYAEFVETVTAAGKAEYDLPMYVNGAQGRPGVAPGGYPSGGPLAHLADIWKAGAPSIDFIAPDIYFPNFAGIVDGYVDAGVRPLFIPEANRPSDAALAANALRSIGERDAIGFSPFAIEDADEDQAKAIGELYAMLDSIAPIVLDAQAEGRIAGIGNTVSYDGQVDESPLSRDMGYARFSVTTLDPWTPRENQDRKAHGGLLIWLGGEDYLLAGSGVTLTVEPVDGKGRVGFDRVEEGSYVDGRWQRGRVLNGDQTHQGRHVRLPPGEFGTQRFRLYRYQ